MFMKSRWYSSRLRNEVTLARWGAFGQPVLVFPTAGGDAEEIERFQIIRVLEPLLTAGRIKLYSCDSVAGRVWFNQQGQPRAPHVDAAPVPPVRQATRSSPPSGRDCRTERHRHLGRRRLHRRVPRRRGRLPLPGRLHPRARDERHLQPDALHRGDPARPTTTSSRRRSTSCRTSRGATSTSSAPATSTSSRARGSTRTSARAGSSRTCSGAKGIPNYVDSWGPEWDARLGHWRAMMPKYLEEWTKREVGQWPTQAPQAHKKSTGSS